MREAIEAVIKDLEARSRQAIYMHNAYMARGETASEMLNYGLWVAYDKAIDKLKGVLAKHDPYNPRQASNVERNDQHGETE